MVSSVYQKPASDLTPGLNAPYIIIYLHCTSVYIYIYMIWYDIWYMIYDIWYMIYDIWYMIWYDMHICMYNVYRVPKFSCASNKLVYMPYVDICWSLGHPLFWGFPHQGSCFTGLHLHLLWQPGLRLLAALLLGTDGFTSAGGCESR